MVLYLLLLTINTNRTGRIKVKSVTAINKIPTNLPLNKKKITTAKPMIIPPRVAVIGVKFTIFI